MMIVSEGNNMWGFKSVESHSKCVTENKVPMYGSVRIV